MLTLEGLRYSPWTEKARWALDHHLIEYRYREHLIWAGMPLLRCRMRRFSGDITVPVLFTGEGRWIMDSFQIARRADELGKEPKLFPEEKLEEIRHWNERCEEAADAARGLVLHRMKTDTKARLAALPSWIPEAVRPSLDFVSRIGIDYIRREFRAEEKSYEEHRARVRSFALAVREALAGGKEFLVGGKFSYADVTVAGSLGIIRPVSREYLRLPDAIREVWTDHEIASEFSDILSWRDRLYASRRGKRVKPRDPRSRTP